MSEQQVWVITGASSGFGLELAKIAAKAGHKVIAASRNPAKLTGLDVDVGGGGGSITGMRLDHNEPLDQIKSDMDAMVALHSDGRSGRGIDVLINNAAYVQTGTLEETTPEETLKQFQANVLGPLNVYRAVLPHMRKTGKEGGTLVTIGSMAAWYPMNSCNLYNASKAAMRVLSLGLAEEVKSFGIRHMLVEPGFFRTGLLDQGKQAGSSNMATTDKRNRMREYDEINEVADRAFVEFDGNQLGDPVKGCQIIYDVVTGTGVAAGRPREELPGFLPLGSDAVEQITKSARGVIGDVERWAEVARGSDIISTASSSSSG